MYILIGKISALLFFIIIIILPFFSKFRKFIIHEFPDEEIADMALFIEGKTDTIDSTMYMDQPGIIALMIALMYLAIVVLTALGSIVVMLVWPLIIPAVVLLIYIFKKRSNVR